MSLSALLGSHHDEESGPKSAIIKIGNGFLFDPDINDRGFANATACATPDDLADAVRAWAQRVGAGKPKLVTAKLPKASRTR